MIFISRNEDGVPAWQLVIDGKKTVTRRLKPVDVGKFVAVQPGRGKKAVCLVRITRCERHLDWLARTHNDEVPLADRLEKEARLEGFSCWNRLAEWFQYHASLK